MKTRLRYEAAFARPTHRVVVAVLAGWMSAGYPAAAAETARSPQTLPRAFAQAEQAPAQLPRVPEQAPQKPDKPIYSLTDLEYLLGPIALYPDPLLAILLPATAFPLQIVQADRWLVANPNAVERGDFSQVDAMPWDPSVQALTRFPDVIKMLADHLDWTESIGMAFSLQSEDVATTVQMMRAKAETAGNLKSTPQQTVTARDEGGSRVIYIAPANPERIYVPVYDSSTVFYSAVPSALAFGTGVLVGSVWNNRWGWNDRRWNQLWIHPPVWHAPPPNWRPPGRPGARPPGAWRPDRPGGRPQRPDGVRPDRPGVRPDRPGVRPDRPGVRPDRPGVRPDRPGMRPDRPAVRPDRPAVRPDRPSARPDRPAARPDRPAVRPDRPGARPDRPAARPDRPAARPQRPAAQRPGAGAGRPANIQRPQARPQRPKARPQTRPQQQQRARPQQGARPQQRARPQGGGGGQRGDRAPRSRSDR